jgi:hypothetical protein
MNGTVVVDWKEGAFFITVLVALVIFLFELSMRNLAKRIDDAVLSFKEWNKKMAETIDDLLTRSETDRIGLKECQLNAQNTFASIDDLKDLADDLKGVEGRVRVLELEQRKV